VNVENVCCQLYDFLIKQFAHSAFFPSVLKGKLLIEERVDPTGIVLFELCGLMNFRDDRKVDVSF
jgi:hypothetical protein